MTEANVKSLGIRDFSEFINSNVQGLTEEIEQNHKIGRSNKDLYINTFTEELNYLNSLNISENDIRAIESEYGKDISRYIEFSFDNYNYIRKTRNRNDLDYYLRVISWMKVAYLNVYDIYKALIEA